MNVHPDCVPCLMRRVLFQSKLPGNGREKQAAEAALRTFADEISFEKNSAKVATKVHRSAYDAMEEKDPYRELKIRADEVAEGYIEYLAHMIEGSPDPFAAAVKVSIIGNIMDFGSGIAIDDPDDFAGMFAELVRQEIDHDDTAVLLDIIERSSSVVYLFDNCGEAQFDKLLIRQIRALGKRVVGVVRGEPILNDVAMDDALRIGLDKEVDGLLTTGGFAIGIDMGMIGPELKEEIERAGVIIAKGMANYESLSDESLSVPVAYIMKAKCEPVAGSLGVRKGAHLVKVLQ
ncbi:MAG: ARMT1-like domain-containing protein [Methanomassiliicoccaceae archaeon]|nr:ARMT1-like domain-containing protein [Methanomassiliicoccaceae archaeon]